MKIYVHLYCHLKFYRFLKIRNIYSTTSYNTATSYMCATIVTWCERSICVVNILIICVEYWIQSQRKDMDVTTFTRWFAHETIMHVSFSILLHICMLCVLVKATDGILLGKQNVRLHEAMRSLLGYRSGPSNDHLLPRGRRLPDPYDVKQEAPKYMLDLYAKFRNTQISKGQLSGNTVRSIHGDIGKHFSFMMDSL